MDFVGFSLWFAALPEEAKKSMVLPASETIGRGLNGIVSAFANPFIKLGMISEHNLKNYETKLYAKTAEIPEINRDDSKQGLAIQALEDSLYRMEEEELLKAYTELITATLDNRKNQKVHPSFSTILRQMSSDDAVLFKKILKSSALTFTPYIPLCTIESRILPDNGVGIIYKDTLVIPSPSGFTIETDTVSLSSLERLGLVRISRSSRLTGSIRMMKIHDNNGNGSLDIIGTYDEAYNTLLNTDYYKEQFELQKNHPEFANPEMIRGSIEVTDLAKNLGNIINPNVLK
ncbi:MAG: DUF4393 domain-containing protein [Enterococcus sp.]